MARLIQSKANKLKELADQAFNSNNYSLAIESYTEAILLQEKVVNGDKNSEILLVSNRSLAYLRLYGQTRDIHDYMCAMFDAKIVRDSRPQSPTGFRLMAQGFWATNDRKRSLKYAENALSLDPQDDTTISLINEIREPKNRFRTASLTTIPTNSSFQIDSKEFTVTAKTAEELNDLFDNLSDMKRSETSATDERDDSLFALPQGRGDYVEKLQTQSDHYHKAVHILASISDIENMSPTDCENFVKELSSCATIEFMDFKLVDKQLENAIDKVMAIVETAANRKELNESARMCKVLLNSLRLTSSQKVICYLNRCVKAYPTNATFLAFRSFEYSLTSEFAMSLASAESALELKPNDEELLYAKAEAMKMIRDVRYDQKVEAYDQFTRIASDTHRKIPDTFYSISSILCQQSLKEAKDDKNGAKNIGQYIRKHYFALIEDFYKLGVHLEAKQLILFMPYESQSKSSVESFLKQYINGGEEEPHSSAPDSKHIPFDKLSDSHRISVITCHREFYSKMVVETKKYEYRSNLTVEPTLQQKTAKSTKGLKKITLKNMNKKKEKVYSNCVIEMRVIDMVWSTGSSLAFVLEDINGMVERATLYNSPHMNDMMAANRMYGPGTRLTIINPYMRLAIDGKPVVRIDDPNCITIVGFVVNMCRYCGEADASIACVRCKNAKYCSKECERNDINILKHKYICN